MAVHHEIHCFPDIGMIAGSNKTIHIHYADSNNNPVDLSVVTEFGCRFLYYGTGEEAFCVAGVSAGEPGVMKIKIPENLTDGWPDTCLEYIPYIVFPDRTVKYGKGRLIVEGEVV